MPMTIVISAMRLKKPIMLKNNVLSVKKVKALSFGKNCLIS